MEKANVPAPQPGAKSARTASSPEDALEALLSDVVPTSGPTSGRYQYPTEAGPPSGKHPRPADPSPRAPTENGSRSAAVLTLTVSPLKKDYVVRVQGSGCLTLRGKDPELDLLGELLGPACYGHRVVLDLQRISRAETSGIAWLMRSTEAFANAGGFFAVYGLPPVVRSMFDILGLTAGVVVVGTEADALALMAAQRPAP